MSSTPSAERPARELLAGVKVIDVDTHISEPLDLWTSRAPAKWRERVPQMRMTDGRQVWTIDGNRSLGVASASSVVNADGSKAEGMEFAKWQVTDVHAGCSQVRERLRVMDEIGVWAQIVYPNVLGFGGQGNGATPNAPQRPPLDPQLRLISTQIYNDAMAEMQEQSGDRLLPMALLPWWDIELALAEAQRCHAMGMRGININSDPQLHGMQDLSGEYWAPLWEFCSDRALPVNFHIGASDSTMSWFGDSPWPSLSPSNKLTIGTTMMFISNAKVVCNLILSGLLERYPRLKFVSVESGLGWLPFILEALEYGLAENGAEGRAQLSMTPLEYFRRQIYACFWFESADVVGSIRRLGVDNCMFETDFPHPTCLYPQPLEHAHKGLAALTLEERRKVMSENAARLYRIAL